MTNKDEIMKRWKEYGQSLFCLPDGETQPTPPPDPPPENDVPPEPPPLLSEVESAIKHLSSGKTPGMDNLHADFIKISGDFWKNAILLLIEKKCSSCSWPKKL